MLMKNYVLGVGVTNETEDNILEYLLLGLKQHARKYFIVTLNPEIVIYAQNHTRYKKILNEAKIALPDGIGVFLGSALMGIPLKERITGVDFMEEICRRSPEQPLRMGFLGGRERVAERTAECLKTRYPWIDVVFVGEEWPQVVKSSSYKVVKSSSRQVVKSSSRQVVKSSSRQVVKSSSDSENGHEGFGLEDLKTSIPIMDILFVAFGHPKQEEWIYENLEHLPVKVAMGVGGAFDYISGRVERAPFMIRAMGMEWLYRLIKEPWRWRRQLALGRFVWLVVKKFIKL